MSEPREVNAPIATLEDLVAILLPCLRARVTVPASVRLEPLTIDGLTVLQVHVDPADVGRIVGRKGHHIRSLRTVTGSLAASLGLRVFVDVSGSVPSRRSPPRR